MAKKDERKRQRKFEKKSKKSKLKQAAKLAGQSPLPADLQQMAKFILDPNRMTTPKQIDEHVLEFCATINPDFEPLEIATTPEDWCRQSCCDLNVLEVVKRYGGKLICGYKIWYHKPYYIEAERHAVHVADDGSLRDPTFSADGESKVVFVADVVDRCNSFDDNVDKIRAALDKRVQGLVATLNDIDRRNPIVKMSKAQSWATMQTYSDWKAGNRQDSVWLERRR